MATRGKGGQAAAVRTEGRECARRHGRIFTLGAACEQPPRRLGPRAFGEHSARGQGQARQRRGAIGRRGHVAGGGGGGSDGGGHLGLVLALRLEVSLVIRLVVGGRRRIRGQRRAEQRHGDLGEQRGGAAVQQGRAEVFERKGRELESFGVAVRRGKGCGSGMGGGERHGGGEGCGEGQGARVGLVERRSVARAVASGAGEGLDARGSVKREKPSVGCSRNGRQSMAKVGKRCARGDVIEEGEQ